MKTRLRTRASLACLLAATLALGGCVTETTGGFNVEVSQQRAFEDYLALARGYLEQGDLANSKRHLNNAAAINRNSAELHGIWGLVYAREGEIDLADESFRRSLRSDRTNSQTRNNYAAFLYANGRFEDAYRELRQVVDDTAYPSRAQAFENLGLAALRTGRQAEAETAFTRALQLNGNLIRSIHELVAINLVKQNISQAEAYFRNYLTIAQFYNLEHSARALWLGIQLAYARQDEPGLNEYAQQLQTRFRGTPEHQLYLEFLEARKSLNAN
jgi:type IV pilus assembly protein PilF